MDPLNQNQPVNPMNQQQNTMVPPTHEKPIGPAIGIIIIIAVIVIGGLYFWGQRTSTQTPVEQTQTQTPGATQTQPAGDPTTQELQKQSSADDLNSIEADLKTTNLNGLGNEVNNAAAAASN